MSKPSSLTIVNFNRVFTLNRYTLMLDCWKKDPDDRPTFTELIATLEEMMTVDTPYSDFSLVDEKETYYDDAFASTSKTVELETHM